MPKDPKRNIDRYKVAGGELNEFEFHQNQGQVKESAMPAKTIAAKESAMPAKTVGAKESATPAKAAGGKKSANPVRGATAKKLAAKKAAKK